MVAKSSTTAPMGSSPVNDCHSAAAVEKGTRGNVRRRAYFVKPKYTRLRLLFLGFDSSIAVDLGEAPLELPGRGFMALRASQTSSHMRAS